MGGDQIIIADSVASRRMWYAFDLLQQKRIKEMPLDKFLIYFTDTVQADVLPYLAQEFDVLGKKGWDFCADEDARRDLIKNAIQMHRHKGTPWAIDQVIIQAGLTGGVLVEHTGTSPTTGWAEFRIDVSLADLTPDPDQLANAVLLVNIYKNARSLFEGIIFNGLDFNDDVVLLDDVLEWNQDRDLVDSEGMGMVVVYDGTFTYDGTIDYSSELDAVEVIFV